MQDGLVSCDLACESYKDPNNPNVIISEYETLNVNENAFENCWVSIGATYDGQKLLIAKNTFTFNTEVSTSGGTYWKNITESQFGLRFIYFRDVFDFTIYKNTFTNTTLNYCKMLSISNFECGSTSLIQANEFNGPSPADNNTVAIQLTDNTDVTDHTSNNNMLMLCNDIDEFEIGIYIDDSDVFLMDQKYGSNAANNTFTSNNKDIWNNGQPFIYYHDPSYQPTKDGVNQPTMNSTLYNPEVCELSCEGWPTVSIEEEPALFTANIYPNPSTGVLTIETNGKEINQVFVYNLSGALVFKKGNQANQSIDLSELPNGMYLMQVQVDEQIINHKIIISK